MIEFGMLEILNILNYLDNEDDEYKVCPEMSIYKFSVDLYFYEYDYFKEIFYISFANRNNDKVIVNSIKKSHGKMSSKFFQRMNTESNFNDKKMT